MTRKPSPSLVARRLERLGWYLDEGAARRRAVADIARAMRSRTPLRVLARAWGAGTTGDTREERKEAAIGLARSDAPCAEAAVTREPCTIANQHCRAAANFERRPACGECFACGQAVCAAPGCSVTTTTYRAAKGRRVRICYDCADTRGVADRPDLMRRMEAALVREAGYPGWAKAILDGVLTINDCNAAGAYR